MKYIVAGGAGFIGSHIVDKLIELNHEVIVLDNLSTGNMDNVNIKAKFIDVDLAKSNIKDLSSVFHQSSAIFHCAALPNVQHSIDNPISSNEANVNTTINILELMKKNNVPKIIYSGSSSIYGNTTVIPTKEYSQLNPLSPYALQKYISELYCQLYSKVNNIQYVIFRYFNVYGERMTNKGQYVSVLSHFLQSKADNKPLNIVNDGEQRRDFVYVKDVVEANILAANTDKANNHIINIGMGYNYTINHIASIFNSPKQYGESRIEPFENLADISLAKELLEWEPKQCLIKWITNQLT